MVRMLFLSRYGTKIETENRIRIVFMVYLWDLVLFLKVTVNVVTKLEGAFIWCQRPNSKKRAVRGEKFVLRCGLSTWGLPRAKDHVSSEWTESEPRRIAGRCKGSPTLQKWFLFNHTTLFSTKGLEKSLYDFTGTYFAVGELTSTTMRSRTRGSVTAAW